MSINPKNIQRVRRMHRRNAWWSRNAMRVLTFVALASMLGLVLLMAVPR